MTGKIIGEWTTISECFYKEGKHRRYKYVTCVCSCGVIKDVRLSSLGRGSNMCKKCSTKQTNISRRMEREYITEGDVTTIHVQGKEILVDTCVVESIKHIQWRVYDDNRPIGEDETGNTIRLYRYLFKIKDVNIRDKEIDHINRNPLDNRMCNLNVVTKLENSENKGTPSHNTSGFVGVSWSKQRNKWRARICKNGKEINLGFFDDINSAVKAREKHEKDIFKYKSSIHGGSNNEQQTKG